MNSMIKSYIEVYLNEKFPKSNIAFHERFEPDDSFFIINPVNGKESSLYIGGQWTMHASLDQVKREFSINDIPHALKTSGDLKVLVGKKGLEIGKFT